MSRKTCIHTHTHMAYFQTASKSQRPAEVVSPIEKGGKFDNGGSIDKIGNIGTVDFDTLAEIDKMREEFQRVVKEKENEAV